MLLLGLYRELGEVPIPQFLDAGVVFTLNADDPLFSVSGVGDEYVVVRNAFELSDDEMAGIARTSVAASHASPATKQRMLDGIDAWLSTPA